MRRVKLAVILCFVLPVLCFWLLQPAAVVTGEAVGGALVSPIGLTASDGDYASKVGLHWQPVRGATTYRIFRNTVNDTATATDVGTTAGIYFYDTTGIVSQQYFYWVRAENGQTVSTFSNADQGSRAFGIDNGPPISALQPPIAPTGNAVTAAKAYLGKALFWDEQLSSTKTVSCGTCHRPASGGSDPRTSSATRNPGFDNMFGTADDIFGSPGVPLNYADGNYGQSAVFGMGLQVTGRKSPSYLNMGYARNGLFWDGRATDEFRDPLSNALLLGARAGLESQVVGPPVSAAEMGHTGRNWTQVASRVAASRPLALAHDVPEGLSRWIDGRSYPQLFEEAFGTPDVTPARISMAIATHERTLFSDRTPLDKWSEGIGTPLTPSEDAGLNLFIEMSCNICHSGPLLTDNRFHNIGVRLAAEDRGRGAITGNVAHDGQFKTPNLRNVELRAPYMRNGRFATLEEVVEFYNRGGDFPNQPNVDSIMRPLNLTAQQKADLVAFMKRPLTDVRVTQELPPFDRPKLYTESNHVPVVSGTGRAGSGAFVPNAIAIEPPLVGNPSFTVAVSAALGAAQAVLVIDSADPGVGTSIPSSGSFARVNVNLAGSGAGNGYGSANLSIPNEPGLVGQTFYGRWYVTDAAASNGFSVSRVFQFTIFGSVAPPDRAPFDFDGDAKTDLGIFRPGAGEWWINRSLSGQTFALQFGASSDRIAPADYTGDGKADIAFFRPSSGEWYVLRSEDLSFFALPFGANGDIPVPADYDADGKADFAVFRPSTATWFISQSSGAPTRIEQFGATGDQPVVSDYDGDGKADIGIFRPAATGAEWWINRSTAGVMAMQFGASTDKPVQGDYTGDGKTDIAIWRPASGEWLIVRSEDLSFYGFPFGANGDVIAPGDYDGDGKFDPMVFRPASATWFIARSTAGTQIVQFGANGDRPLPNAFVP
jgi:cytochrome c peroxidase